VAGDAARAAFVGVDQAADHLGGGVVHDCEPDFSIMVKSWRSSVSMIFPTL
jgi:hypothetical protein